MYYLCLALSGSYESKRKHITSHIRDDTFAGFSLSVLDLLSSDFSCFDVSIIPSEFLCETQTANFFRKQIRGACSARSATFTWHPTKYKSRPSYHTSTLIYDHTHHGDFALLLIFPVLNIFSCRWLHWKLHENTIYLYYRSVTLLWLAASFPFAGSPLCSDTCINMLF